MGKYFGTDGFRGEANVVLTVEHAFKVGRYLGWYFGQDHKARIVIGVLTQSKLYEKTVSNMMECKSRGAYLMGVTNYGNYEMEDKVDFTVYVPKVDEHFMGSLAVIPLQLLGYYVSVAKGLDVDKPRNLAKSVTVE